MSDPISLSRAFLRRPRRAAEVVLGTDGRPAPVDLYAGLSSDDPEEVAEAADIVERARQRGEEIVRRAVMEAGEIERQAREAGFRDGVLSGMAQAQVDTAQAQAELARVMAVVQRAAAASKATHDALLRDVEREAVELVVEVARQVIGESIERDTGLVMTTVRRALERAGTLNVVRIHLHPDDEGLVRATLAAEHGHAPAFEIVADGVVTVGGCIIDTDAGRIDARLDVQLEQIAQALLDAAPPSTAAAA